jgi:protoheme IX farnesyltransferase
MITALSKLFRPRLALLNGVTALGGYCLFPAPIRAATLLTALCGVTLLAMGGSALNQLLDRDIDALMTRTMQRPLPQGRLSATTVVLLGAGTILAGLVPLIVSGGRLALLLGVAALAWYLAVYTPLKRRTTLALPIGALCGAFPPLIGWSLAGGEPADYRIIILAGLLFIWQIPHFWLLQERHEADYRLAGIPLIGTKNKPAGRDVLFWLWMIAFIAGAMLLPAFGIIGRPAALWYAAFPLPLILLALMRSRLLFTCLNLFPVMVTLVLLFRNSL